MKELNISDELLSKFLEGNSNRDEDEQLMKLLAENPELLDELVGIAEASKLAEQKPLVQPDLDAAMQTIHTTLTASPANDAKAPPYRKHRIRLFILTAAAVAAVLLVSTIYLLLRPSDSQNNLAQESGSHTDSTMTQSKAEQIYIVQNEDTGGSTQQKRDLSEGAETPSTTDNETSASGEVYHRTQVEERSYATTDEANNLVVTKPNKDNYRVLCKNLDKSLDFEWTATNVRNLHLTVTNAQGKKIADVTNKTLSQYPLKYKDIYPEKQLKWTLKILFEDGTSGSRSGQIEIDYQIQ